MEKSLLEPSTRSDPAKLGALLAESFFEFGSSGNIWHKRKYTGPELENGFSPRNGCLLQIMFSLF
ncbi:nuclear transport factor 2 family protein [Heyndrickxia coagulans]|uniref:nuclear transport factor 2 family protein n=1 Tax=Heyndrickxia coagulans TaxID=1398 RepID=UPI002286034C|nr:nuclear transport factor 2 family protein [Heyndrickxia coagulans]